MELPQSIKSYLISMNNPYTFAKGLVSLRVQTQHLHIHARKKRDCFQTLVGGFLTINDICNAQFILHYLLRKCCIYLNINLVYVIWAQERPFQITSPDCTRNLEMTTLYGSMGSASDNRLDLSCQKALSSCLWAAPFHLCQLLSSCEYHRKLVLNAEDRAEPTGSWGVRK